MRVSRNVVLWSKHFDIRILDPMFYLKLCNRIYIYICIRVGTTQPEVNKTKARHPFGGESDAKQKLYIKLLQKDKISR